MPENETTAVEQEPKATDEVTSSAEATEAPATAEPVDDIDAILAEYDQSKQASQPDTETEEPTETPKQEQTGELAEVVGYVKSLKERQVKEDISRAVSTVKETSESLQAFDDEWIEARLNLEAQKDPRVRNAWLQREANPEGWNRLLGALGKKIAGNLARQPDPQLTADREAARESVRGSSTKAPEGEKVSNEQLNKLSDAEFNRKLAEEFGYRR